MNEICTPTTVFRIGCHANLPSLAGGSSLIKDHLHNMMNIRERWIGIHFGRMSGLIMTPEFWRINRSHRGAYRRFLPNCLAVNKASHKPAWENWGLVAVARYSLQNAAEWDS